MIAHSQAQLEAKGPFTDRILDVLVPVVAVAAIGALIPAAFWGTWYLVSGSIPKLLGFSRFWLDVIAGAFYIFIIAGYLSEVLDSRDELSEDENWHVTFWEFITEYPWLSLLGLFLAVDFIASLFLSFAFGLAAVIALAIVVAIGYGLLYLIMVVAWAASNIFTPVVEEPEEIED